MGDYNRGFLYPYFLAVSSHPRPPINNAASCISNEYVLRLRTVRSSFIQSRKRKISKFTRISTSPSDMSVRGELSNRRAWNISIRPNEYTNKDPRNNFPKSTFRIIEKSISRISRWEIKKKRKKIARLKIFKLKFPNWPRLLSIALKTNRPNCPNDEYNINRFDSISADTEIFLQLSNNCLVSPFAYSYRSWYDRNVWSKPRRYFAFREPRSMPGKTFILLVNVPEEKRLYFRGTKNMHARFHIVCLYHIYIYIILKNRVYQRVRVYTHARGNRYSPCQNVRHRSGGGRKIRLVKSGGTIINNSDTDYRLVSSVRLPRKRFKEFSMRMRYASMYR